MPITGTEFEKLTKPFFRSIFTEMGFSVWEVRNQNSGTQSGFDIKIVFGDETGIDRKIFVECKYYGTKIYFSQIIKKIIELNASNYTPDAFIALSPKENLSNIDDNIKEALEGSYKFPSEFWTPDKGIDSLFALDPAIYKKVFDKDCKTIGDRTKVINRFKNRINFLLAKRDALALSDRIQIEESRRAPKESSQLRTSLDKKLDVVFSKDDAQRLHFHQLRCNYKIFLEDLQDVNNILRKKVLNWQDNLRLKASRLTGQFHSNPDYTPTKFFYDFFATADTSLASFYIANNLDGDQERLLHGVVFELAAECPLDWRPI